MLPLSFGKWFVERLHLGLTNVSADAVEQSIVLFRMIEEAADLSIFRNNPQRLEKLLKKLSTLCCIDDQCAIHEQFLSNICEELEYSAREYFGSRWKDSETLVKVNRQRYFELTASPSISPASSTSSSSTSATMSSSPSNMGKRRPSQHLHHRPDDVINIDSESQLADILANSAVTVVLWFSGFCQCCNITMPEYNDAAMMVRAASASNNNNNNNNNSGNVASNNNNNDNNSDNNSDNNNNNNNMIVNKDDVHFVKIEGPNFPRLRKCHQISQYPTITIFKHGQNHSTYTGEYNAEAICKFLLADYGIASSERTKTSTAWSKFLSSVQMRTMRKMFRVKREMTSMVEMFRALGCSDEESCAAMARSHSMPGEYPPTMIFLGGGMGAGKTSILPLLAETDFWKKVGDRVVIVEADAFKMNDPIYMALNEGEIEGFGQMIHKYSSDKAEELLLVALNMKRDIVLDGTMSWAPFVEQTVEMIRDFDHVYKRGPGYQELPNGEVQEDYWVKVADDASRQRELGKSPYQMNLVGVTVDAALAVQRGIIRRIIVGRGVPIRGQLSSHKMFSQNFDRYIQLFDQVTLYDNTTEGSTPIMIASKEQGKPFVIHHREAYERFLEKRYINVDAEAAEDVFRIPSSPSSPTLTPRHAELFESRRFAEKLEATERLSFLRQVLKRAMEVHFDVTQCSSVASINAE